MGCGASQPEGGARPMPTPLAPAAAGAPTTKIDVAPAPAAGVPQAAADVPEAPKVAEMKDAKEKEKAPPAAVAPAALTELFKPLKLGAIEAKNRFIMGPMSRNRAAARTGVPGPLMVKYYSQRAKHAGLVISESVSIGAGVFGFKCPGIYSQAQIAEWKKVTDAVHAAGGKIVCQIAHGGRTAHPVNGPNEKDASKNPPPFAPSPIRITSMQMSGPSNATGDKLDFVQPVELSDKEIPAVIALHVFAAKNAIAAGFDGVEVHCANGFLLDQFWRSSSNKRASGKYSGESVETRCAFPLDVVSAIAAAIGSDRVGIRISPLNSYHEMSDAEPEKLTRYLCEKLNALNIAYVHLIRADFFQVQKGDTVTWVRESFKGTVIGNMGYQPAEAEAAIHDKKVDAVAFASLFLANPDLPERAKKGAAFNAPIAEKFYNGANDADEEGYTSYPTLA